jgi:hypothetical protein
MKIKPFALLTLAGLLASEVSRAETISYTLSGTVLTAWGNPFNGISPQAGDPITGLFTYDTASTLITNSGTQIVYYGQPLPNHISLTLRGVTFETGASFTAMVANNLGRLSAPYDQLDLYDYAPGFPGAVPENSLIEIQLTDFTGTAFSSTSLPHTLNLAAFNSQGNNLETVADGVNSGVTFQINSLSPIPEPSVGLLLISALALARVRLRRIP